MPQEPYLADDRVRYVPVRERLGLARHKSSLVERGHGKVRSAARRR